MLEKSIKILIEQMEKLNYNLNKNKFIDLIEVMGNKKEMIFRNLFSGLWKGIGIGIGVTLVTIIVPYDKNMKRFNIKGFLYFGYIRRWVKSLSFFNS